MLGHVVRAVRCGAVTVEEAAGATGLEVEDLHGRHLSEVLATRGGAGQLPR